MKKITILQVVGLMALANLGQMDGMQSLPASRSVPPLCVTCPTGAAKFCSLCVTGPVVVGDLTVQNSITLCPGVTLPCFCCYNDSLTWGPAEMLPQASAEIILAPVPDQFNQPNPSAFQPFVGSAITLRGWPIFSPFNTGVPAAFITAQFEVPLDMNVNVTPSLILHFFYPSSIIPESWLRFQIDIELLGHGEDTAAASTFTILSQNVEVFAPVATPDTLRHYQVQVPLVGLTAPALAAGRFGAITISRVVNTEDPQDEADTVYLSALSFNYRKSECPLV